MKDFQDSVNWDDVQVQRGGYIYHGHRINIENMSDEEREHLRADLTERKIIYTERKATTDSPQVRAGDLTIRVVEPESVEKLRYTYFGWAHQGGDRPAKETVSEYEQRQQKIKELQNQNTAIDRETAAKLINFAFMIVENGGFKTVPQNADSSKKGIIRDENVARAMKLLTDHSQMVGVNLTGDVDHWTRAYVTLEGVGKDQSRLEKMLGKSIQANSKSQKEYQG